MAEPFDSAFTLQSVSNIIREKYAERVEDQVFATGSATNRLFKPDSEGISGDGKTFQVIDKHGYAGRMGSDILADFPAPARFGAQKVKMRINERDPSSNDLVRFSLSIRTSEPELKGITNDGQAVDLVETLMNQARGDTDFLMALHRNLSRTARVALVNGTPAQNDRKVFADASATPSTSAGLRVPIDNGPIMAFQPGLFVEFRDASTGALHWSGRVTDYNPADNSVGFENVTSGPITSSGTITTVVDNDEIYISGERNQGMYSLGAWFSSPTTTDSFIGGVNRSTATYRYLQTTQVRESTSTASRVIAKSDFDDLANAMSYVQDMGPMPVVFLVDPTMATKLRNDIIEDLMIPWPSDSGVGEKYANMGSIGLTYQHPIFGVTKLLSDPLAIPNTVRFITPEYWRSQRAGNKGLTFMPGTIGNSFWNRLPSATPGNGGSMFYQAEAYMLAGDWCYRPRFQGQISNVTAS